MGSLFKRSYVSEGLYSVLNYTHFRFFKYIVFTMHIKIHYILIHIKTYIFEYVKIFGTGGVFNWFPLQPLLGVSKFIKFITWVSKNSCF